MAPMSTHPKRNEVLQALDRAQMILSQAGEHACACVLTDLTWALLQLDLGEVVPMLQLKEGHPPDSGIRKAQKIVLVAGCKALQEAGLSKDEAQNKIVKLARDRKIFRSRGDPVTNATLSQWLKDYRSTKSYLHLVRHLLLSKRPADVMDEITAELAHLIEMDSDERLFLKAIRGETTA